MLAAFLCACIALAISSPFEGYARLGVFALALTVLCVAVELTREKGA